MNEKEYLEKCGYVHPVLVGQGAFSKVYRVEESVSGVFYACKVSRQLAMLSREAEILKELQHPLFPEFADIRQEAGRGYLLTEYISGVNLEELVRRRGGFSEKQTLRMGIELAEGLAFLQERRKSVLYRDLKPHNLKVCEDGRIKLLDFGCACYADDKQKACVGTPGFGAPEQLAGGVSTSAGDVYAFGRLLTYLLCGNPKPEALCGKKGKISKELIRFIAGCTADDPQLRFPDMRICLYLISDILEGRKGKNICSYEQNVWKKGEILEKVEW